MLPSQADTSTSVQSTLTICRASQMNFWRSLQDVQTMTSTALAGRVKCKGRSMYLGGAAEQSQSIRHIQHLTEVMT